jgi:hypothetical protein
MDDENNNKCQQRLKAEEIVKNRVDHTKNKSDLHEVNYELRVHQVEKIRLN